MKASSGPCTYSPQLLIISHGYLPDILEEASQPEILESPLVFLSAWLHLTWCIQSTMSALSFPLERVQPMASLLQRHSRLLTTGFILSFAIQRAISNYHAYLALEPGGSRYNIFGWLQTLCFQPLARETLSTEQYDQDENKQSFLDHGEIKERRGDRPKMGWHVFPSRQLDRHAPPGMRQVRPTCRIYGFNWQLTVVSSVSSLSLMLSL